MKRFCSAGHPPILPHSADQAPARCGRSRLTTAYLPAPNSRRPKRPLTKRCKSSSQSKLARYATDRNQPEQDVASGLSPYLHAGHISAHQVFAEVTACRRLETSVRSPQKANGSAQGWWGASEAVESFLDELITWREVGFNMCSQRDDYDQYDSLPDWSRKTLGEHAHDPRDYVYSLEQFENSRNTRSALECRTNPAGPRRPYPQLPADAVGQEGSRVVGHARRMRSRCSLN